MHTHTHKHVHTNAPPTPLPHHHHAISTPRQASDTRNYPVGLTVLAEDSACEERARGPRTLPLRERGANNQDGKWRHCTYIRDEEIAFIESRENEKAEGFCSELREGKGGGIKRRLDERNEILIIANQF